MRIRELVKPNILVYLTNEEAEFLRKNRESEIIDTNLLDEREKRLIEGLIFKDIVCRIGKHTVRVNEYVSRRKEKSS
jgi:hypothetical protein